MKELSKVIKKVLKEQSEMYVFSSPSGGALLIPKSSQPTNVKYIDMSSIRSNTNDENFLYDKWGNWGREGGTPKDVCKNYHKDQDLLECLQMGYVSYTNRMKSGSVTGFSAIDPLTMKRQTYTSCYNTSTKQKVGSTLSDFDKWTFDGYYPQTRGLDCLGNKWGSNVTSKSTEKGPENFTNQRLKINLLMTKSS